MALPSWSRGVWWAAGACGTCMWACAPEAPPGMSPPMPPYEVVEVSRVEAGREVALDAFRWAPAADHCTGEEEAAGTGDPVALMTVGQDAVRFMGEPVPMEELRPRLLARRPCGRPMLLVAPTADASWERVTAVLYEAGYVKVDPMLLVDALEVTPELVGCNYPFVTLVAQLEGRWVMRQPSQPHLGPPADGHFVTFDGGRGMRWDQLLADLSPFLSLGEVVISGKARDGPLPPAMAWDEAREIELMLRDGPPPRVASLGVDLRGRRTVTVLPAVVAAYDGRCAFELLPGDLAGLVGE